MKNGCNGRILRVNLSRGNIQVEEPEEEFYLTYGYCAEHGERRLAMNAHEETKERIMEAVSGAPDQRIRPIDLERKLKKEHGLAPAALKDVLKELMGEEELVFTYRDPCNYVEIPAAESHHAARPMRVLQDKSGESWICDADVDSSGDLAEQGCWRCRDLAFTASD